MTAPQAPPQRGAGWHERILAADPVVDGEHRGGKARAKLHPEPAREAVGASARPGRVLELARAVVLGRDGRHVGRHDAGQHVRVLLAPFVVVASSRIGSRSIGLRRERPDAGVRAALRFDQVTRVAGRFPFELAHDRSLVADDPFVVDPVVAGVAVRDDAVPDRLPARLPVRAVAGVRGGGEDPVRAEQPLIRGAAPDDVLAEQLAVGKLRQRRHGGGDDLLVSDHHRCGRAHHDVRRVERAKRADTSSFPDLPGHPQYVVRKVPVLRVESFQESHPFGMRAELRLISTAGRQTLRGGAPGSSMLARSILTVSATIADASCRTVVRS